jgi:uncharacterized membrane protein YfcA
MPPTTVFLVAGIAVAVGALVQSGVGLGLGVVASPVVTLLDPALMPGSMLVAGAILPVLILRREAGHTDWPGVSWALAGRLAGTAAGIWVLTVVPPRALGILVGTVVLAVVTVTSLGIDLPRNRWTLLTAGVVSGTTGTATSIGGPPVALLYQREHGPRVRASMSLFLCAGNSLALTALALTGHLPIRDVETGLIFLACAAAGLAIAARFRRFLDAGRIRAAVLLTAAASAAVVIIHSLAG